MRLMNSMGPCGVGSGELLPLDAPTEAAELFFDVLARLLQLGRTTRARSESHELRDVVKRPLAGKLLADLIRWQRRGGMASREQQAVNGQRENGSGNRASEHFRHCAVDSARPQRANVLPCHRRCAMIPPHGGHGHHYGSPAAARMAFRGFAGVRRDERRPTRDGISTEDSDPRGKRRHGGPHPAAFRAAWIRVVGGRSAGRRRFPGLCGVVCASVANRLYAMRRGRLAARSGFLGKGFLPRKPRAPCSRMVLGRWDCGRFFPGRFRSTGVRAP